MLGLLLLGTAVTVVTDVIVAVTGMTGVTVVNVVVTVLTDDTVAFLHQPNRAGKSLGLRNKEKFAIGCE